MDNFGDILTWLVPMAIIVFTATSASKKKLEEKRERDRVQSRPVEEYPVLEHEVPIFEEGKPAVERTPVASVEEKPVQQKKHEKIDARKLVLYSEIMKPKFDQLN